MHTGGQIGDRNETQSIRSLIALCDVGAALQAALDCCTSPQTIPAALMASFSGRAGMAERSLAS